MRLIFECANHIHYADLVILSAHTFEQLHRSPKEKLASSHVLAKRINKKPSLGQSDLFGFFWGGLIYFV